MADAASRDAGGEPPDGGEARSRPPVGARLTLGRGAARPDPVQEFFSIGEVCALTGLKPHVLRYWETQFRVLHPAKNRSGNRVYARREVELVLLVKQLLYAEKYTIDGARRKLETQRKGGELRAAARAALAREVAESIERELCELLDLLDGRRPAPRISRETSARPATGGDPATTAALPAVDESSSGAAD